MQQPLPMVNSKAKKRDRRENSLPVEVGLGVILGNDITAGIYFLIDRFACLVFFNRVNDHFSHSRRLLCNCCVDFTIDDCLRIHHVCWCSVHGFG